MVELSSVFQDFRWSTGSDDYFLIGRLGEKIEPEFLNKRARRPIRIGPHPPSEEAFEWIALLCAVVNAKGRFVMAELGAGFGRWLVSAACALRQRQPGLPFCFVGLEAEPTHFRWMLKHFLNNGIEPTQHRLIHGAIAAQDGEAELIVGMEGSPSEWYGQTLVGCTGFDPNCLPPEQLVVVPTYSIDMLLSDLDRVDILDCDVQGAEREAIPAGIEAMTRKVKRAFVATHFAAHQPRTETDGIVWRAFQDYGWISEHHFEPASEADTEFGRVQFEDGVQSWINPSIP